MEDYASHGEAERLAQICRDASDALMEHWRLAAWLGTICGISGLHSTESFATGKALRSESPAYFDGNGVYQGYRTSKGALTGLFPHADNRAGCIGASHLTLAVIVRGRVETVPLSARWAGTGEPGRELR